MVQYLTILFDHVSIGPARIGVVEVQVAVLNRHGLALQTVIPFGFAQITTALGDGDFFANGLLASPVFAGDGQANVVGARLGVSMLGVSARAGMTIAKIPTIAIPIAFEYLELVFPIAVVLHHEIALDVAG